MRVKKYLINAVKKNQDQNTNHLGRHMQALKNLTKIFRDTTAKIPEETPPKSQTPTNPTQPNALRATTSNHHQVTRYNTPGIISSPVQNQNLTTKTSKGGQITYEGA